MGISVDRFIFKIKELSNKNGTPSYGVLFCFGRENETIIVRIF